MFHLSKLAILLALTLGVFSAHADDLKPIDIKLTKQDIHEAAEKGQALLKAKASGDKKAIEEARASMAKAVRPIENDICKQLKIPVGASLSFSTLDLGNKDYTHVVFVIHLDPKDADDVTKAAKVIFLEIALKDGKAISFATLEMPTKKKFE